MIGAIAGDIIGSVYEWENTKKTDFYLYHPDCQATDDTILTVATADHFNSGISYVDAYVAYGRNYPDRGFGGSFAQWLGGNNQKPYGSWGNGSAMRVSPVGYVYKTMNETLEEAKRCAEVTHNHPEGIKGAQATAASVHMAWHGASKDEIKAFIEKEFSYNLSRTLDEIRPTYTFDVSCQGSVPEAIIAFLESNDFEDAIRKAISIGGDSDTIACITGGIAEAFYKSIPDEILTWVRGIWPDELTGIIDLFVDTYMVRTKC